MTSGEFTTVRYSEIRVNRDERQRKDLRGIEDLARSIKDHGLIHPLVVTREHVLVAGERRYSALGQLGWTSIPVQYTDEMDPVALHILELEENIKREDISWQDWAMAVDRYFDMRKAQDPQYNGTKCSNELNMSQSKLSSAFLVAKELKGGNNRVAQQDLYSTAVNVARRETERRNTSNIAVHMDGVRPEDLRPARIAPLLNMAFETWLETYDGPKFNLLHCDFPYGIGMHDSDQGAGKKFGEYHDSEDVYWKCLDTLGQAMVSIVEDSAHLMFWFSMEYYCDTIERLEAMGWRVNRHPLVWHKSDNVGILSDPRRAPRRIYETCLHASRGDRFIVRPVSNVFSHPGGGKEIHMNEKPIAMLKYFMGMFCDEYSTVLDPTCGSANALKAAQSLGSTSVLGLERDGEFYQRAVDAYFPKEDEDVLA